MGSTMEMRTRALELILWPGTVTAVVLAIACGPDVPAGNETLMSVDLLDSLALNGTPEPPAVQIRFNPLLPEALVHEKLDALGVTKREVCGNMEGGPECFCSVGE